MRKILSMLLSCILALLLAACGGSAAESSTQDIAEEAVQETAEGPVRETAEEAVQETAEGPVRETEEKETDSVGVSTMKITVGDTSFTAALADNSSAEALKELLLEGPLTIDMSDYADMEKVGPIGTNLPRNDEQLTTEAGDIILYQGNSLVIYYDTNSWNFTRIGKIHNVTGNELLEAFGKGEVTVTFSLE